MGKAKNSNSYCSSEERNRSKPKSTASLQKKVPLGFREFHTCFWEVDHPLCDVFFLKKLKFLLLIRRKKYVDRTQKITAIRQKKFPYGLEHFVGVFGKLTTPSGMFSKQKTQILIAHRKESIDRTQKNTASRQKKFS